MAQRVTRRDFVKSGLAAAGFTILSPGSARGAPAAERVHVAAVGVWNIGSGNRRWLARAGAAICALCDVDRSLLDQASLEHPQARKWTDFRRMLEEQKDIDAVMVSTPDHTHAVACMTAMRLGKHVCCEKPLTHSVAEARMLAEAAKRYEVATQLDIENHSSDEMRQLVEWIRAGAAGAVSEVHIWTDRPIWPQGISRRPPAKPVPENLEWELWLGPAPRRDYHEGLHPFYWRSYWDFGTGALGDMGCHFFDAAFWALRLGQPERVEAISKGQTAESGPRWSVVTYRFPARGDGLPQVTLKWYDGGKQPPRPEELPSRYGMPANGSLFVGEKGKILVDGAARGRILPEERRDAFREPAPFIPPSPGHKEEWLAACKGGPSAGADFAAYGGPLTEVVLLGNVAIRAGTPIEWDPAALRATNAPEVERFIRREYRKGWEL